jgi:hypothetical protein
VRSLAVLVAFTACGGGAAAPADAACADAAVCEGRCVATFTGNFYDSSADAANCAELSPQLVLNIESPAIGSPLAISIDLGASPTPGTYSSETVASWTAVQARSLGDGGCVYSAGSDVVPVGSFTLDLAIVDGATAHGTLDVLLTVHALEATNCGAASTEAVDVVF